MLSRSPSLSLALPLYLNALPLLLCLSYSPHSPSLSCSPSLPPPSLSTSHYYPFPLSHERTFQAMSGIEGAGCCSMSLASTITAGDHMPRVRAVHGRAHGVLGCEPRAGHGQMNRVDQRYPHHPVAVRVRRMCVGRPKGVGEGGRRSDDGLLGGPAGHRCRRSRVVESVLLLQIGHHHGNLLLLLLQVQLDLPEGVDGVGMKLMVYVGSVRGGLWGAEEPLGGAETGTPLLRHATHPFSVGASGRQGASVAGGGILGQRRAPGAGRLQAAPGLEPAVQLPPRFRHAALGAAHA